MQIANVYMYLKPSGVDNNPAVEGEEADQGAGVLSWVEGIFSLALHKDCEGPGKIRVDVVEGKGITGVHSATKRYRTLQGPEPTPHRFTVKNNLVSTLKQLEPVGVFSNPLATVSSTVYLMCRLNLIWWCRL